VLDPLITAIAVSVGAASRSRSNLDASETGKCPCRNMARDSTLDCFQGLRRIVFPGSRKLWRSSVVNVPQDASEPEAVGECRDVSLARIRITPNNSDPVSVEPATLCWLASGDAKVIGGRP